MPSILIDCVIEIPGLREIECEADVEYTVDGGELSDWSIRDFLFTHHDTVVENGVYKVRKMGQSWCPESLRPALFEFVNKDAVESDLVERLYLAGECYSINDDHRRDYEARVL